MMAFDEARGKAVLFGGLFVQSGAAPGCPPCGGYMALGWQQPAAVGVDNIPLAARPWLHGF